MEGRVLPRPNHQHPKKHAHHDTPSMEGRVLPRPNVNSPALIFSGTTPSMEGRVLPRPNSAHPLAANRSPSLQWRVGCYPDRIPFA